MKKYIKPIVVMLAIILACGGLLAILSDLLFVSTEERINRAIGKIYTEETVTLEKTIDVTTIDMTDLATYGEIKACYELSNGDLLILSRGKKGYSNGTVTTYVAIDNTLTVKKVVQDSYTAQTLMSKLTGIYDEYEDMNSATDKSEFDGVIVSGATYSSIAVSNSVYVAIKFAERLGG